jgi:hypothetical protein
MWGTKMSEYKIKIYRGIPTLFLSPCSHAKKKLCPCINQLYMLRLAMRPLCFFNCLS